MTYQGCFDVRSIITLDHHFVVGSVPCPRHGRATVRVNRRSFVIPNSSGIRLGFPLWGEVGSSRPKVESSASVRAVDPREAPTRGQVGGLFLGELHCAIVLAEVEYSNVLIALRLNGKTLPHEHGGPCRLIATGKECHFSVKWIDRIDLRSSPSLT